MRVFTTASVFCVCCQCESGFTFFFCVLVFVQSELVIDVEVDVRSSHTDAAKKQVIALRDYLQNESKKPTSEVRSFQAGKETMVLERVEAVGSITGVCADGQVYDSSAYHGNKPCGKI